MNWKKDLPINDLMKDPTQVSSRAKKMCEKAV